MYVAITSPYLRDRGVTARYNGGLCNELCILQISLGKPHGRLDTGHDLNEDQFFTTILTIAIIIFFLQRRICCQNQNLFTKLYSGHLLSSFLSSTARTHPLLQPFFTSPYNHQVTQSWSSTLPHYNPNPTAKVLTWDLLLSLSSHEEQYHLANQFLKTRSPLPLV